MKEACWEKKTTGCQCHSICGPTGDRSRVQCMPPTPPPQCCICMSPAGPMNSPNRAARKRDPRRPHVVRRAVNMWPYARVGREMPFFPFHSTVINLSGITALRECKSTHTQTPQRLSNAFNSAALVDPPGLIIAFSIHPLRPRWHIDPTP